MSNQNFATAREVVTALSSLNLAVDIDVVKAISRSCREIFLNHLSIAITNPDAQEKANSAQIIKAFVKAGDPECIDVLRTILNGKAISVDLVLQAMQPYPIRFVSAIDAASNPKHPRQEEAKDFIDHCFTLAESVSAQSRDTTPQTNSTKLDCCAPVEPASKFTAPEPLTERLSPSAKTDRKFRSKHVYGSAYALCFNAGEWDGRPGVMVDAAAADGTKSYDWDNAIHLWLNESELGAVLAVFRRWRKGVELSGHGAQNDKSFTIEFQGQHFFAKVSARKANSHPVRAVRILSGDATAVSILVLQQLAASYPDIPLPEVLSSIRATHQFDESVTA